MPSLEPPDLDRTHELMELQPSEVMARYRAGLLSRREIVKLFAAMGMVAATAPLLGRGARAAEDINIICWAGYTDDSFRKPFEEANNATINSTFAASSDEMFAAMSASGGKNYDLVSASNDLTQRLVEADLVMEIDPTKLTNWNNLYDQFKTPPTLPSTTNSTA